ncbi:MAG: hypothetical protein V3S81_05610 [Anaerolineales bacterium]
MSDKTLGMGGGNLLGAGFGQPEKKVDEGALPSDDIREVGGTSGGVTSGGAAAKGPASMDNGAYGKGGDNGPKMNKGKGNTEDGKVASD